METLILSWYILVETQSVFLLSAYASLQFLGTLVAPMVGVLGDRIGPRNLLVGMRATYTTLALVLLTLIVFHAVAPVYVFIVSGLVGLVRSSDMGIRVAVVADFIPAGQFVGAVAVQRTTQDLARIAGALAGGAVVASVGMAPAYVAIASLYATSVILMLQVPGNRAHPAGTKRPSPWRDLKAGAHYVWTQPHILATMYIAFLINLTAFPLLAGLQPYVAREIYGTDQTGLGYLVAGAGCGALFGSLMASRYGRRMRQARMIIIATIVWYVSLFFYAFMNGPTTGIPFLFVAGFGASMSQVPMQSMVLTHTHEQFRGRVMGIRMLAIYGNVIGLLIAGPLITSFGYRVAASLYCTIGITATVFIAYHWRAHIWRRDAPANSR